MSSFCKSQQQQVNETGVSHITEDKIPSLVYFYQDNVYLLLHTSHSFPFHIEVQPDLVSFISM